MDDKVSSCGSPKKKAHKGPKSRGSKKPKTKMTKEERREKYTAIARNRREANMSRARDKHLVCYKCRKSGHSAENCKNVAAASSGDDNGFIMQQSKKKKGGSNICYKCGSIEHRIQLCPKIQPFLKGKSPKAKIDFSKLGELPFANCYICSKSGHLSSTCPLNTKGVYPKGGSCKECGSVFHYAIDCPEKGKKDILKEGNDDVEESVTIDQYLEEEESNVAEEKAKYSTRKKRKVVNF